MRTKLRRPSIHDEIVTALGLMRYSNESEQAFLNRVIRRIDGISDETWSGLSIEAQDWAAKAALAHNENQPIPSFGDQAVNPTKTPMAQRVKELLVEQPRIHSREIFDRVTQEGFKTTFCAVQVECGHFRSSMKFLEERGLLKKEFDFGDKSRTVGEGTGEP